MSSTIPPPPQQQQQPAETATTPAVGAMDHMDWPTNSKFYTLAGKIGQGAFATVWRACVSNDPSSTEPPVDDNGNTSATSHSTSASCAVKVLNLDHVDTNLAEIRREVQAMRLSSHPNVLTCYTAFVQDTQLWLVTQLMRKGSSLHCLQTARRFFRQQQQQLQQQQQNSQPKTANSPPVRMEDHIFYILHETLLGLKYIHDNGQIHRDIKAGNILLDSDGHVCIADFGVSGWLVQGGSQLEKAKTFIGTPCWMAPEVMEQIHGYDYKADIWSLGITALELAKGYAPYAKYPPMKVLILTIQEDPPSLDSYDVQDEGDDDDDYDNDPSMREEYSKAFRTFIDTCLQKNPAKRPNCQELLYSKQQVFSKWQQGETGAGGGDTTATATTNKLRAEARERLRVQICEKVPDVGDAEAAAAAGLGLPLSGSSGSRMGHSTVSIILSSDDASKDRPAGTTWVFADGSQVLSSSATTTATTPHSVDDVLDSLDEFGKQTGGENYDRRPEDMTADTLPAATGTKQEHDHAGVHSPGNEEEEDDLNKFMDEFELHTAGEDYRRR